MACRKTDKRKIQVFEENGRKLTLNNTNDVETVRIEVDGCEINDATIRCDFMLVVNPKGLDIYVELKGTNLEHAKKQIIATHDRLSINNEKRAYIVCSRVPKGTGHQAIKIDLKRKGIDTKIVSNQGFDHF